MATLNFPAKRLRADVLAPYIYRGGYKGAVVFGCGNGARELEHLAVTLGFEVLDISQDGDLAPTGRWWHPEEIARTWPGWFDATSGHLPLHRMVEIARHFHEYIEKAQGGAEARALIHSGDKVRVPTGSGETLVCLALAYPRTKFVAVYGDAPEVRYDGRAPLNGAVASLAEEIERPLYDPTKGGPKQ